MAEPGRSFALAVVERFCCGYWTVRLLVRSSPFQGEQMGSKPIRSANPMRRWPSGLRHLIVNQTPFGAPVVRIHPCAPDFKKSSQDDPRLSGIHRGDPAQRGNGCIPSPDRCIVWTIQASLAGPETGESLTKRRLDRGRRRVGNNALLPAGLRIGNRGA